VSPVRSNCSAAVLLLALAACAAHEDADSGAEPDSGVFAIGSAEVDSESTVAVVRAAAPNSPPPRLAAPRFAFDGRIEWMAETPSSLADSTLLLPTDLQFARAGLLVFDAGASRIRVVNWSPRLSVASYGRAGRGPGEHSIALRFQGTYDRPMAFDRENRRHSRLERIADSIGTAPAPNRPIKSSCLLGDGISLGTISANDMEFFRNRSSSGDPIQQVDLVASRGSEVIDSSSLPLPELLRIAPIGRQAVTQQLDDSTCVLIAYYQSQFAVTARSARGGPRPMLRQCHRWIRNRWCRTRGGRLGSECREGAKISAIDARAWRDMILVLYEGSTRQAGKLLDVYRRSDLTYRGSFVLPDKADRIAVSGDTLAVIAERGDTPIIQLFRLSSQHP
jgi:hypothetical protein